MIRLLIYYFILFLGLVCVVISPAIMMFLFYIMACLSIWSYIPVSDLNTYFFILCYSLYFLYYFGQIFSKNNISFLRSVVFK